jgi:ribonucleoside-diphosphate reductase alpha chain
MEEVSGSITSAHLARRFRRCPLTQTATGLSFAHKLTKSDVHPFDAVAWDRREAVIQDAKGRTVFAQQEVEVPAS